MLEPIYSLDNVTVMETGSNRSGEGMLAIAPQSPGEMRSLLEVHVLIAQPFQSCL